jgi:hypothetical protein
MAGYIKLGSEHLTSMRFTTEDVVVEVTLKIFIQDVL